MLLVLHLVLGHLYCLVLQYLPVGLDCLAARVVPAGKDKGGRQEEIDDQTVNGRKCLMCNDWVTM